MWDTPTALTRQLLVGPASLPVTPWKDATAEMTGTEAGPTKQDGDIQPRAPPRQQGREYVTVFRKWSTKDKVANSPSEELRNGVGGEGFPPITVLFGLQC